MKSRNNASAGQLSDRYQTDVRQIPDRAKARRQKAYQHGRPFFTLFTHKLSTFFVHTCVKMTCQLLLHKKIRKFTKIYSKSPNSIYYIEL